MVHRNSSWMIIRLKWGDKTGMLTEKGKANERLRKVRK